MLKKSWIPIVCVLIGVAIGGTLWSQHLSSQEPIKIYQTTPMERQERSEGGHWHGDEWHAEPHEPSVSESEITEEDQQARIDAEIEAARHLGASDAEILKNLQAAGYPVDADFEIHAALYRQRVRQYLKDREAWNQKFHQAHTERMQVGRGLFDFIPDGSPKEIQAYFSGLSDAEKKQLQAKILEQMSKIDTSDKKLDAVAQEEPIFPTKE